MKSFYSILSMVIITLSASAFALPRDKDGAPRPNNKASADAAYSAPATPPADAPKRDQPDAGRPNLVPEPKPYNPNVPDPDVFMPKKGANGEWH